MPMPMPMTREQALRMKLGDQFKIVKPSNETWATPHSQWDGKTVTLAKLEFESKNGVEEVRLIPKDVAASFLLHQISPMVNDPPGRIDSPELKIFVKQFCVAMEVAGVPRERIPTEDYLTSKIVRDWLDKDKIKNWVEKFLKEEVGNPPLDLDIREPVVKSPTAREVILDS
jgi:hypothetical protein